MSREKTTPPMTTFRAPKDSIDAIREYAKERDIALGFRTWRTYSDVIALGIQSAKELDEAIREKEKS